MTNRVKTTEINSQLDVLKDRYLKLILLTEELRVLVNQLDSLDSCEVAEPTPSSEINFQFGRLPLSGYQLALGQVMVGIARGRVTLKEFDSAKQRIRAGANKVEVMQSLAELSIQRFCDTALGFQVARP